MKNVIKRFVAFVISLAIALSGVVFFDLSDVFTIKTEAAILGIGDTIEFGRYPQTKVTDPDLISILEELPFTYAYENIDITNTATQYNEPREYLVEYGIDTYYKKATEWKKDPEECEYDYYKIEPINWIIINGNKNGIYLFSEKILDYRRGYTLTDFYATGKTNTKVKWEETSLNRWLNKVFINLAFSMEEESEIVTNVETGYKVFIPSYDELTGEVFKTFITSDLYKEYWFDEKLPMPERIYSCALVTSGTGFLFGSPPWYFRRGNMGAGICTAGEYHTGYNEFKGRVVAEIDNAHNHYHNIFGVRPAIYVDLENINIEELKFKENYPTLEEEDAINFLKFIYNQKDDSKINAKDPEIKNCYEYKILTGEIFNEDLSVPEIQNRIRDFCWIVEVMINGYIDNSINKSDLVQKQLVEFLCDCLKGEITEIILDEPSRKIIKDLARRFYDRVIGGIPKYAGASWSDFDINKDLDFIIDSAKSYLDIIKAIQGAVIFSEWSKTRNTFGKYTYFNACVQNCDNPYDEMIDEAAYITISDETWAANIENFFGKGSWQKQKDDIDRWAEQFYQLQQYSTKELHKYETVIDEPTCTEPGTKRIVCVYCDLEKSTEIIVPKGHTYQKTTVASSCERKGYDLYECLDCDEFYKTNYKDKTDHINYTVTLILPTCNRYGYDLYSCVCGETWTDNYVEPVGHSYKSTVVEPTETEQGYTVYECSACENKYFDNYIDPVGHEFNAVVTKPTCEAEGFTTHICSGCGYEYIDSYVDITEHSYELISETKATCTSEGERKYSCKDCGVEKNEPVAVLEHDYTYATRIVEPACEEQGYTLHICVCESESKDEPTDASGHNYAVIETVEVTCITEGLTKYECTICNHTYSDVVASKGHSYKTIETVKGNCIKSSYTLKQCTKCNGLKYEDCIYADGHDMGDWEVVRQATSTQKGLMRRACDDCDYSTTQEIKYNIYISLIEPSERTVTYGKPIKLYVNAPDLPSGYKIAWSAKGNSVSLEPSATGRICTVSATSTGNVVISASIVNSNGNIVTDANGNQLIDTEYLYTKANLFMKIFEFFRMLFGFEFVL